MNKPDAIPEKFAALINPKTGAPMTTRSPRKAASVFRKLIREIQNGKGRA